MDQLGFYVIVEFCETAEVATVLRTWLNDESQCYWPKQYNRRLLVAQEQPKANWDLWKVRILSYCEDLKETFSKEKRAQDTSDLTTEPEVEEGQGFRLKKRSKKIFDSESSGSESDLPPPRKIPIVRSNEENSSFRLNTQSTPLRHPPPRSTPHRTYTSTEMFQNVKISKLKEQISRIERSLLQVRFQQKDIIDMCSSIMELVKGKSSETITEDKDIIEMNAFQSSIPFQNLKDFLDLENSLSDESKKRITAAFFKETGGANLEENIRRILQRMVTDDVAIQFSWEGRRGKRKLCDLAVVDLMRCVMSKVYHRSYTEKKFETKVREWFRQSSTRFSQKNKQKIVIPTESE